MINPSTPSAETQEHGESHGSFLSQMADKFKRQFAEALDQTIFAPPRNRVAPALIPQLPPVKIFVGIDWATGTSQGIRTWSYGPKRAEWMRAKAARRAYKRGLGR